MFAYDDVLSLEGLTAHAEEANRYAHEKCFYILVCNKVDIQTDCEVIDYDIIDYDIIDSKREFLGCTLIFYVSALTGRGVKELLDAVFERMANYDYSTFGGSIKLTEDEVNISSTKCCNS